MRFDKDLVNALIRDRGCYCYGTAMTNMQDDNTKYGIGWSDGKDVRGPNEIWITVASSTHVLEVMDIFMYELDEKLGKNRYAA